MVRLFGYLVIWLFVFLSFSILAKDLDNSQVYSVPSDEQWLLMDILKNPCDVCTSDIYIQSGSARINGVWVSGVFEFSVSEKIDILFDSDTKFALGDIVQKVSVETESNENM
ncbi:TPA: hypothetical protein ACGF9M_003743 [Vibrio cholerae]